MSDELSNPTESNPNPAQTPNVVYKECQVFSGCRCNICGAYFGDYGKDTICANGHEIGHCYPIHPRPIST